MNPQTDQTPGFGMPQPPTNMGQVPPMYAPQNFRAPDSAAAHFANVAPSTLPAAPSVSPLAGAPAPGVVMQQVTPVQAMPMPGAVPITSLQSSTPSHNTVQAGASPVSIQAEQAEDADTPLDEEWVGKAKDVIGHTQGDPYLQSIELSKLKAQYIKARYNKDIKVSD